MAESPAGSGILRRWAPCLVTVLIGVALTVVASTALRKRELTGIRHDFESAAEERISLLEQEIQSCLLYLESLGTFIRTDECVDRGEFGMFVRRFLNQHPRMQALKWIVRVPHSERERFEDAAVQEGFPEFRITERNAEGIMVRAGEREEYFPVFFVEPYAGNEVALGFDIGSEAVRLEALKMARDTGETRATGPIRLVQEKEDRYGTLVFVPVYRRGSSVDSVETHRDNLMGFALGVIRLANILDRTLAHVKPEGLDLCVFDASGPPGERALYHCSEGRTDHLPRPGEAGDDAISVHSAALDVAGRQWVIQVLASPEYIAARKGALPWVTLGGGLLCTALLVGHVFQMQRRERSIRRFAAETLRAKDRLELEIEARRQAQGEVNALTRQIEYILGATRTGLDVIDSEFNIQYIDPEWRKVYGDPAGRKCYEYFMGRSDVCPDCGVVTAFETGQAVVTEETLVKEGNRPIQVTTIPFQNDKGEWLVAEVNVDLTEHKRAEEELRRGYEAQAILNRLLAISLEDISLTSMLEQFLDELTSVSLFRMEPRGAVLLVEEDDRMLVLKTQRNRSLCVQAACVRVPFGKCLCGRAAASGKVVFSDHIDERHEIRHEGMEPHGHYCVPILSAGKTVLGVLNLYVAEGHQWAQHEEDFLQAVAGILAGLVERKRAVESLQTSKEELEEANRRLQANQNQLIQSEKMASIGQLAAGVAHEINNPVGFVMSNLGTLSGYVRTFKALFGLYGELTAAVLGGQPERQQSILDEIHRLSEQEDLDFILTDVDQLLAESSDGTNRVKEIVQNLKSFARVDEAQVKEADINEGIEATLKIVWNELKYKCSVRKKLGSVPRIRCYPGQLNQVFMNLLVNAAQAIPEKGDISIETGTENGHLFIRVSDTGCGIPPAIMSRIFDPFYTSKPVGKGTGLGLAIAHGIVKKHNGVIDVESEVGKGTTFTIRLPVEGVEDE